MSQSDSHVELKVHFLGMELECRGPIDWVDAKLDSILSSEKLSQKFTQRKDSSTQAPNEKVAESANNSNWNGFDLGKRAKNWLSQSRVESLQLETVFHGDSGNIEVISTDFPGTSKKTRTLNAYLVEGVRKLFEDDVPKFKEEGVLDLCKAVGCYDSAHHSEYRKDLGNLVAGSKESGYTLTGPGLTAAATLIKSMHKGSAETT